MLVKNLNIRLFQKKNKQKELRTYFLTFPPSPYPLSFQAFYFNPRNSRQNKASPLETKQNCVTVHPSEILRPKTKTQGWKIHVVFNQRLSVSVIKENKNPPMTYLLACLPDANKEIFCMSLPKCVLPFLTNQVAQFISYGDIGCF